MTKQKFSFSIAFTLAEVLITLGIIGIVAAMTIPSLINKTQNAEFVTGLKKAYSIISQATERVQQDEGDYSNWNVIDGSTDSTNTVFNYYKPYFNIIKDCGNDGHDGCWTQAKNLYGTNYSYSYGIGNNIRVFTLADGMNISMDLNNSNGSAYGVNLDNTAIDFIVDVNGNKKPNRIGKDVFMIFVENNRIFPAGKDDNSVGCSTTNTGLYSGMDCAAKVLREGKIDY